MTIKYISQREAQQDLMSHSGAFSIDALMELAGLSCACALAKAYPVKDYRRVLVCCGPGNQGGDGLVAARHLRLFGYTPTLFYPKPGNKDIYKRLLKQCQNMNIPSVETLDAFATSLRANDVILDAIFGFSFQPPLRAPFDKVLTLLKIANLPIVSVDIPSGWDVTSGPQPLSTKDGETIETFTPDVLISLTAPKEGVKSFTGRHFLGGRFIPRYIEEKYDLNLPPYPSSDQIVEL